MCYKYYKNINQVWIKLKLFEPWLEPTQIELGLKKLNPSPIQVLKTMFQTYPNMVLCLG